MAKITEDPGLDQDPGTNNENNDCPKTTKVIDDCKKGFEKNRDDAQSETRVAYTHSNTASLDKTSKSELYVCAYKANKRYTELSHGIEEEAKKKGVSVKMGQDIQELTACITAANKKDEDLEALLKAAVMSIREAKDALKDMYDVACVLKSCVDDSKNSEQLKILKKTIVEDKEASEKKFMDIIKEIMDCAELTKDYADTNFEASVKVYSLNGYNNVEVLGTKGEELKQQVDAFTGDISANVTFNGEKVSEYSEKLTESIIDLSKKEYVLCKDSGEWEALHKLASTKYDLPILEENSISPAGLKKLCEEAQKTFTMDDSSSNSGNSSSAKSTS